MTAAIDLVHVIFKTHLDLGFTDYAHNVSARYFNEFMPRAVALAEQMRREHPEAPFCWTTGAWLVVEYLATAAPDQRAALEAAIADGLINWHALPFTTHTELMDAPLMRAALGLAAELDARFGRQTIAAKMTDVPGHTRALIPLLAEAGVRFLHIGVNPASTVPDVPPIFVWRDDASDSAIICIYHANYGASMVLPGTTQAVALVFTGDNEGPPTPDSVLNTYAELRRAFPNARLIGSTLDAVARALLPVQHLLPVVTAEIGDTWIHGVGSDPKKVAEYRALLRLRQTWLDEGVTDLSSLQDFQRKLLLIPEHTWGMDLKTHLDDYTHYDTPALAAARQTPNFQRFEASWSEQRAYIDTALRALPNEALRDQAMRALSDLQARRPQLEDYTRTDDLLFEHDAWRMTLDPITGAITQLDQHSTHSVLADAEHPLALLRYDTYSTADYERYWKQYIRDRERDEVRAWAHPDNVKPGLQVADHGVWLPRVTGVYQRLTADALHVLLTATFAEAAQQIGAPREVFIAYALDHTATLSIEVQWFEKPACRLPEAFWLSFRPRVEQPEKWLLEKLGAWVSPLDVVSGGARTLHAVGRGARYDDGTRTISLHTLDAPLIAPGAPSLLDFHNRAPDLADGLHVNLFNNLWGTNFTMWFEDDMRFRCTLELA